MVIQVQTNRQRTVRQAPVSAQKQNISAPADAFGASNARATQGLGTALDRFADDMGNRELKALDKVNRARALDLESQMQSELNDFLYNTESGLLKRKGADAASAQSMMQAKLKEIQSKYIGMPGEADDVNEMVNNKFRNISKSYEGVATRHAFGESENYEKDALSARLQLNRQEAALDFLNEDNFQSKLSENIKTLEVRGDLEGWSADRLTVEKQKETSTLRAAQITAMVNTDRPHNIILAKQEFEAGKARGDFIFEDAQKMETALNAAVPKAAAQLEFERLGTGQGGVVGRENIIAEMVDNIEGGAEIAQEPRGAIAKFGINSEANPDVDVKNLSRDQAIGLYKKRYWDAYGIDDVPENLQFLAFDIAVNHRSDFARTLIEEMASGNIDADGALAYRLDEYRRLATKDPAEYGRYFEGWKGRLEEVSRITRGNKLPSINDITASAEKLSRIHPDAGGELMKMYESSQKRMAAIEKAQKDEFEDTIHEKVAQSGGDYTILSAAERAQAAEMGIDYTKYSGVSNPDVINQLDAMTSDELFSADLTEFRGELTFEDLNTYRTKQADLQKPENKVVQDKIDQAVRYYFRAELSQDPDNKKIKPQVASMKRFVETALMQEIKSGKPIDQNTINAFTADYFRAKVYDPEGPLNKIDDVFTVNFNKIPDNERLLIEQSLIDRNQPITEDNIRLLWIQGLKAEGKLSRKKTREEQIAER